MAERERMLSSSSESGEKGSSRWKKIGKYVLLGIGLALVLAAL